MCKVLIQRFVFGVLFVFASLAPSFAQSQSGQTPAQSNKPAKRASGLIDLELLTRAEQRVDAMRARLLELQTRESDLQDRLYDLDYQLSPQRIDQALMFVGSVRPMDERRDALRARIENEKARVNKQLELLESTKSRLEASINDADAEVARLRQRVNSRQD